MTLFIFFLSKSGGNAYAHNCILSVLFIFRDNLTADEITNKKPKISSKNNRSNFETLKTRIARLLCIIPRHKWCHWQFQFLKPVLHLIKYLFLTKALLSSRINSSIVTFVQSKSCKSFQNVSSILSSHRLLNFNLVQNNGMMQMQRQKSSVQK